METRIIYLVELTADSAKSIAASTFGLSGDDFAATHGVANYARPGWNVVARQTIRENETAAPDGMPDFRGWMHSGFGHSVDSEYITGWLLRRDMQAVPVELTGTAIPRRVWVKSRFAGWKTAERIRQQNEAITGQITAIAARRGITNFSIIETHTAGPHSDYALIDDRSQNGEPATLVIEFGGDSDGPFETIDTLANHNASTAQLNREWRDQ